MGASASTTELGNPTKPRILLVVDRKTACRSSRNRFLLGTTRHEASEITKKTKKSIYQPIIAKEIDTLLQVLLVPV